MTAGLPRGREPLRPVLGLLRSYMRTMRVLLIKKASTRSVSYRMEIFGLRVATFSPG